MENKEHNDILKKPRSYRAVVASGFHFYASHFRTLFKSSWLFATIFALLVGIVGWMISIQLPAVVAQVFGVVMQGGNAAALLASQQRYLLTLGVLFLLFIVCLVPLSVALSGVTLRLREHASTQPIIISTSWWRPNLQLSWRTIKGCFTMGILVALPIIVIAVAMAGYALKAPQSFSAHTITVGVASLVWVIIVVALSLPLAPTFIGYLLNDKTTLAQSLRHYYPLSLRRWGSLFAIFVVDFILALVVDLIICLPAKILMLANMSAQMGMLYGDPLGMPSYTAPLTFVTFALCAFFQFFATLPVWLHIYYAYGSIMTHEDEHSTTNAPQA